MDLKNIFKLKLIEYFDNLNLSGKRKGTDQRGSSSFTLKGWMSGGAISFDEKHNMEWGSLATGVQSRLPSAHGEDIYKTIKSI